MSDIVEAVADAKFCPVCPVELDRETLVEPEIDGEHRYYECDECGYAWGYERVGETRIEGMCAIGIPESVRRQASAGMETALASEQRQGPVPLGMPTMRPSQ